MVELMKNHLIPDRLVKPDNRFKLSFNPIFTALVCSPKNSRNGTYNNCWQALICLELLAHQFFKFTKFQEAKHGSTDIAIYLDDSTFNLDMTNNI